MTDIIELLENQVAVAFVFFNKQTKNVRELTQRLFDYCFGYIGALHNHKNVSDDGYHILMNMVSSVVKKVIEKAIDKCVHIDSRRDYDYMVKETPNDTPGKN